MQLNHNINLQRILLLGKDECILKFEPISMWKITSIIGFGCRFGF